MSAQNGDFEQNLHTFVTKSDYFSTGKNGIKNFSNTNTFIPLIFL